MVPGLQGNVLADFGSNSEKNGMTKHTDISLLLFQFKKEKKRERHGSRNITLMTDRDRAQGIHTSGWQSTRSLNATMISKP